jgi:hypothetical protein
MVSVKPERASTQLSTLGVVRRLRERGIERSSDSVRWYARTGKLASERLSTGQHIYRQADVDRLASELIAERTRRAD